MGLLLLVVLSSIAFYYSTLAADTATVTKKVYLDVAIGDNKVSAQFYYWYFQPLNRY
ncbi:unnamed protein product [Gongylonema pulchrum]|uniref:Hemocyanin_N domain-containing protein n=1 Tax=Gongylonema pulchrum TaxID=637853 RepID=A0A183E0W2_9BILA|nr:unnamed protein product [Gongylonema pulchrum]